ncbi:MAG: NAD(P)H-dependent oxidoreductase [Evtepia sp.]
MEELCLDEEDIRPLHSDTLGQRHALEVAGKLDGPMFRYARQFAAADRIVIGAPYWEYQFPALLRCWVEHVAVGGLTLSMARTGGPTVCAGATASYISRQAAQSWTATAGLTIARPCFPT